MGTTTPWVRYDIILIKRICEREPVLAVTFPLPFKRTKVITNARDLWWTCCRVHALPYRIDTIDFIYRVRQ